jgi:hypothetical protein
MSLYHPGLFAALAAVDRMDREQCLRQIDALYGRDEIDEDATLDELRFEASRQTRLEFRNNASPDWEIVDLHVKIARELRGAR